jgi:uncharacterized protein YjbJ (UPF0337 family)
MKTKSTQQKLNKGLWVLSLLTVVWIGVTINFVSTAQAMTRDSLIAMESNPINEVFGAGTTDKIEGKAEQDIGTIQKNVGQVKKNTEGTIKQIEGRAKQDTGEVKNRLEKASSNLEDASESAIDSVKSLLGK